MNQPQVFPEASLSPAEGNGAQVFRCRRTLHRGLASVELVLSIPIILMVMALSVIVGNAACWKIRAVIVARNEIWAYRKPRSDTPTDASASWPAGWPQSATMNHSGSRSLPDLNVPAFQNPLVHGPLPNVTVNSNLLNPTQSVRIGSDHIQRTPPMLARLGDYSFSLEHALLDGTWAYWQTGQYYNDSRRMPDLYPNTPPQNTAEKSAYDQAYQAIANAPFWPDLAVLDRDPELRSYYGNPVNFHPSVNFCSLDPTLVREKYIISRNGLLARIANVPKAITSRFLSMYRAQLQALQNANPQPPGAQSQIAALQQKIQTLQGYLSSLP